MELCILILGEGGCFVKWKAWPPYPLALAPLCMCVSRLFAFSGLPGWFAERLSGMQLGVIEGTGPVASFVLRWRSSSNDAPPPAWCLIMPAAVAALPGAEPRGAKGPQAGLPVRLSPVFNHTYCVLTLFPALCQLCRDLLGRRVSRLLFGC